VNSLDLTALRDSTDRLLSTVRQLSSSDLAGASGLPGWSRGHVVGHLVGNARAIGRLATWAQTGIATQQYASAEAREAEIFTLGAQPLSVLIEQLQDSATELEKALEAIPPSSYDVKVKLRSGRELRARRLPHLRRQEVEIHHVDLDMGYRSADWPDDFVAEQMDGVARSYEGRKGVRGMTLEGRDSGRAWMINGGGPPTLTAPDHRLLAWLTGREPGRYLVVTPAGPPPKLPTWA
jgi:maleylpyruvate isomerase